MTSKLQFLAERLQRAKADAVVKADEIAARLDEYEAKAPGVFEAAHGAVTQMQNDAETLFAGVAALSNSVGNATSNASDDDIPF